MFGKRLIGLCDMPIEDSKVTKLAAELAEIEDSLKRYHDRLDKLEGKEELPEF